MKGKDLKNILSPLTVGGKTFNVSLNFNAMCELEDIYGDINEIFESISEGKGRLKAIRALVYSMISAHYSGYTLNQVGEMLTPIMSDEEGMTNLMEQINKIITLSNPPKEDKNIDSDELLVGELKD